MSFDKAEAPSLDLDEFSSPDRASWEEIDSVASRLFSASTDKFDIMLLPKNSRELHVLHVDHDNELTPQLLNDIFHADIVLYVIKQNFSWSPFNIRFPTIRKVLGQHNLPSALLALLSAFGARTAEDENVRDEHYFRSFGSSQVGSSKNSDRYISFELCYNCRYPEENGRGRGDPWSLRQIGVYSSYDSDTQKSVWIILQPSIHIFKNLEILFQKVVSTSSGFSVHAGFNIHNFFLSSVERKWHHYLEHLRATLDDTEEKACFSKIDKTCPHDYILAFSDRQKLHLLHKKFQRVCLALEPTIQVLNSVLELYERKGSVPESRLLQQHRNLTAKYTSHKRKTLALIQRLQETAEILAQALEFRNHQALAFISKGMQENLTVLRNISFKAQQDQCFLRQVALQGQQDSKSVKALTLIMTMYLPASLLAQVFSSNLVQLKSPADTSPTSHFVLSPQFWIFGLVTAVLMLLTLAVKVVLQRNL